jgi:hypothetical protein
VRVPSEAGEGIAKVNVSIPDWKKPPLAPVAFAVPLNAATPKFQAAKRWNEK